MSQYHFQKKCFNANVVLFIYSPMITKLFTFKYCSYIYHHNTFITHNYVHNYLLLTKANSTTVTLHKTHRLLSHITVTKLFHKENSVKQKKMSLGSYKKKILMTRSPSESFISTDLGTHTARDQYESRFSSSCVLTAANEPWNWVPCHWNTVCSSCWGMEVLTQ